jgi:hypothetical protein
MSQKIVLFMKSHVDAYVRGDGVVVQAHESGRTAAPATAEGKIRHAANQGLKQLGKPAPIHVDHSGRRVHFMARIDKVPSPSEQVRGQKSVVHLSTVKRGRLMAGDEPSWIMNHHTLNGKDELKDSKILPHRISDDEARQFHAAHGLQMPGA